MSSHRPMKSTDYAFTSLAVMAESLRTLVRQPNSPLIDFRKTTSQSINSFVKARSSSSEPYYVNFTPRKSLC